MDKRKTAQYRCSVFEFSAKLLTLVCCNVVLALLIWLPMWLRDTNCNFLSFILTQLQQAPFLLLDVNRLSK